MPASQDHITAVTPMGAWLVEGGATFALWSPGAQHVYLARDASGGYVPRPEDELVLNPASGQWTGFFPGVGAGALYRFFVVGPGGSGLKRDPWARELDAGYPDCDCIVVDPNAYPWHDEGFRAPAFEELIIYQFHIGAFYACDDQGLDLRPVRAATFLDALDRVEYLADLGVTAVQPLPVVEFQGEWSLGYNGTDLFSPERDYTIPQAELAPYLVKVNRLLATKGCAPLTLGDLSGQVAQLKVLIDICHLFGLAVIIDVVYNHAGGGLDLQSLDHIDWPANPDKTNSIYFSTDDWAGGRVFAFTTPQVQDFLIGNAEMFLSEYHADGLRFDEVTVIDQFAGWSFCQRMTQTLRQRHPAAILIAEYWGEKRWLATARPPTGMGFDLGYADGLRNGVRDMIQETEGGASALVDLGPLRSGLQTPVNVAQAWQADNCIENHDLVLDMDGDHRHPRIPRLADTTNPRSWYARSRSRVATAALLTSPGTPMLFMGQEFLEDKLWSDDSHLTGDLIWWDGLGGADPNMADFHRFTRDLIGVRRRYGALRANSLNIYPPDVTNRVAVFQRWVEGYGGDVVVVLSLNESTFHDHSYAIGLPEPGHWHEVFNSDLYDHFPNPLVQGNPDGVDADGPPLHSMNQSAGITIAANAVLVFSQNNTLSQ
jgi:1,4-alpha-glucan branching enzyme